ANTVRKNASVKPDAFLLSSPFPLRKVFHIHRPVFIAKCPARDKGNAQNSLNIRLSRRKGDNLLIYFLKHPFLARNLLV
ncbi:hypothetical protein, partial [Serratia marcescens]|uniref:hypothetical protein n=1 Tax=Serratia marcescens TaxID=615 RepID=UPI00195460CF